MTKYSSSVADASRFVSTDPIDVYLNSVEQVLINAGAPRTDRLQVLQDLEAQIADMLAQQPQPLTNEAICSVIAQLEPPSHFAADYGDATEAATPTAPTLQRRAGNSYNRWAVISAASCAGVAFGSLLLIVGAAVNAHGPVVPLAALLLIVGVVLTPIALHQSYQQLRAEHAQYLGRELVTRSAATYFAITPIFLLVLACAATEGYILFPIGIAAFLYLQYVHTRRLWLRLDNSLPPQSAPGTGTGSDSVIREPSANPSFSLSTAISMPAM
jgi:hypothetical protein